MYVCMRNGWINSRELLNKYQIIKYQIHVTTLHICPYMYKIFRRLLSSDPEAAKRVVLAEKPVIADDTTQMDPALLDLLINNLSTLVSIYHKPAETFVQKVRNPLGVAHDDDDDDDESDDDDDDESGDEASGGATSAGGGGVDTGDMLGLGDMGMSSSSVAAAAAPSNSYPSTSTTSGDLLDFFGGGGDSPRAVTTDTSLPELVDAAAGAGMLLRGKLVRENASISLDMQFHNVTSATVLSQFAVQFNKNTFALAPVEQKVELTPAVQQGQSMRFSVPVAIKPTFASKGERPSLAIQVAMKDMVSNKVHFFQVRTIYSLS
jgi:AP-1 complex subunit beta-1